MARQAPAPEKPGSESEELLTYVFVLKTSDGGEEREAILARDDAHARALAEITGLIAGIEDRLQVYDPNGGRLALDGDG